MASRGVGVSAVPSSRSQKHLLGRDRASFRISHDRGVLGKLLGLFPNGMSEDSNA